MLCLAAALASTRAGLTTAASTIPYVLFVDRTQIASIDSRLELRLQPPQKRSRIISPTEPWESWAVFAYNSVVAGNGTRPHRMYYDCIEGTGVPPGVAEGGETTKDNKASIAHRRICLATSFNGIDWEKPNLGIFNRNGSTANNILLEDSGVSVFKDDNPLVEENARWKLVVSNGAYVSFDGVHNWTKLPWTPIATDDTKPTARWDAALQKYVVFVRRDDGNETSGRYRQIGRCVTSNISNWQQASPGGCDDVFGTDAHDPPQVDVYTNAWTPYPGLGDEVFYGGEAQPQLHLFFPSMYRHFTSKVAPWGFGNDGLLDIRLVIARDIMAPSLVYTSSRNARSPFVPLGPSRCGGAAHAPTVQHGWCDPTSGAEADGRTSFDSSAAYMASGYVPSPTGDEIYFYSSGQPFTHGGDAARSGGWGNNTGIRLLTLRRDGFVAVEAPYVFATSAGARAAELPLLTTVPLRVPTRCAPPKRNVTPGTITTTCSYEYPDHKCPPYAPAQKCILDTDCNIRGSSHTTCLGARNVCDTALGICSSASGAVNHTLCEGKGNSTTRITGGVELVVNMETSVVGSVTLGLRVGGGGAVATGFTLGASDALVGSAVAAVASWSGGALASLSSLAGQEVSVVAALSDAKLFSLRMRCAPE